ncbi:MAG TPA: 23S rRNA (adenine(2503)-C(2))-methyltransferase RlmN [Polyangiales bacterium]|nr:23S rRNA (adenine(2503)-C(2))-methyltransferase RlmN [Polyangiales bacterium]
MKPLTPPLMPAQGPLERLPEEWAEAMVRLGEPKYRGLSVFRWIHQRGVLDPDQMTDLPKGLREKLRGEGLAAPMEIVHEHLSDDTTRKLLLRLGDEKDIESVLIPQRVQTQADVGADDPEEGEAEEHTPDALFTQCISTQVGCAMGCVFCASGQAGLKRNLTTGEIVAQVLIGRRRLGAGERLRNIVLMGMGEPLANYDNVARALVLLTHPDGLNLSRRRVTLSTSGLVPQIDRLGTEFAGQVQLAVSLHQVDDERRSALMPINRKHPIGELLAALKRYPLPKRRRITIEYTLVNGQNDSLDDARKLAKLMRGLRVKVNLIPMNPIDASQLGPSSWATVDSFQALLIENGIATFVRRRKGADIAAACGQLALHGAKLRKSLRVNAEA